LVSPANGAIFNQPEITLRYNPTDDWKGGCPNNSYYTNVFMGKENPDGSLAYMGMVERYKEAMGSAAVVGANVEITGVNMPAVGTQMRVKLTYQSNAVYVDRPKAPLRRGWALYPWAANWSATPEACWTYDPAYADTKNCKTIHETTYCQPMSGLTGWDAVRGNAWFSSVEMNLGTVYSYKYWFDQDNLCYTYDASVVKAGISRNT
jgi:hypothetical protein